jgi:hypothetical protein
MGRAIRLDTEHKSTADRFPVEGKRAPWRRPRSVFETMKKQATRRLTRPTSLDMFVIRITRPISLMEDSASSSVTVGSTMAAKTLSKPITLHTFGVASTWLLACNILSTLDTIVTAAPCSCPLSGFIWNSRDWIVSKPEVVARSGSAKLDCA